MARVEGDRSNASDLDFEVTDARSHSLDKLARGLMAASDIKLNLTFARYQHVSRKILHNIKATKNQPVGLANVASGTLKRLLSSQ